MGFVTGPLPSGTYAISNVNGGKYANLKDSDQGSAITTSESVSGNEKWNIQLNDKTGKYTIKSVVHYNYAKSNDSPNDDDIVQGKSNEYYWEIKTTAKVGQYLIQVTTPSEITHYWNVADSNINTKIRLNSNAGQYSHWQFTRVEI